MQDNQNMNNSITIHNNRFYKGNIDTIYSIFTQHTCTIDNL